MKTPFLTLAAAAVAISSLTFAQNAQPGANPQGRTGQMSGQTGGESGAQMTGQNYPTEFVRDASSGNQMEIQIGQYVSDHAQDSNVKKFAQNLVQDHKDAEQKLKLAAQQAGIQFTDQLTPVHKAMVDELTKLNGPELEREFIFSAVGDHHKDILAYTFASQNANNAQLKQYASQCLPILQKHLSEAESLVSTVTGIHDATASQR